MTVDSFLLMRHELLLALMLLIIICAEIMMKRYSKNNIIPAGIILFLLCLISGFLPTVTGSLFGGMFHNDAVTVLMKNILNTGVFIILLQSAGWLQKENNHGKVSEFFMLILSTLIGMNFMISSGHFLMLYLGLELATIPMAALAAYDKYRNNSAEAGIKLILSSALSSGILLYGISLIYGSTGLFIFC